MSTLVGEVNKIELKMKVYAGNKAIISLKKNVIAKQIDIDLEIAKELKMYQTAKEHGENESKCI